jgi:hypothetical protein
VKKVRALVKKRFPRLSRFYATVGSWRHHQRARRRKVARLFVEIDAIAVVS